MIFFMKAFLQQRGTFQRSWICIRCWEKNKHIPQMVFSWWFTMVQPVQNHEINKHKTSFVAETTHEWKLCARKIGSRPNFHQLLPVFFWIVRNVVRTAGFRMGDGLNWLHGGGSLSTTNISCKYQNFLGEKNMFFSSWWLNQPLWNIWVKMGTFPK